MHHGEKIVPEQTLADHIAVRGGGQRIGIIDKKRSDSRLSHGQGLAELNHVDSGRFRGGQLWESDPVTVAAKSPG